MVAKIKSFTLIEVVLAMLLAAIVIGLSYSAFTLFTKLYRNYESKNLKHAELLVLKRALLNDVNTACYIGVADHELILTRDTAASDTATVRYSWTAHYLMRYDAAEQDTFKLSGISIKAFFEQRELEKGIADRLEISFRQDTVQMQWGISKQYDSKSLFNKPEVWNP